VSSSRPRNQDLDRTLKSVCEDLIAHATSSSTAPLRPFLSQTANYLSSVPPSTTSSSSSASAPAIDLSSQPFATPSAVLALHEDLKVTMTREVQAWIRKLRVYLEDDKAVEVLIPPMQVRFHL
jgi:hypothetical protein